MTLPRGLYCYLLSAWDDAERVAVWADRGGCVVLLDGRRPADSSRGGIQDTRGPLAIFPVTGGQTRNFQLVTEILTGVNEQANPLCPPGFEPI